VNTHSPYQLTRYPIGSLREIWTISWPLMLGLLSTSLMMFADRLLLARYSMEALNASATSTMAAYVVLIIPLITAGISEVFVGRSHGAGKMLDVGKVVWPMLWLAMGTLPFFLLCANILPVFFFTGTGNEKLETEYFQWLIYFAPAFCSTIALTGFFIGIGKVRTVTWCALLGNVVNVGLDILLIYGYGLFPEMGIKGAAIATRLSQLVQTLFLGLIFLKKSYRDTYGTAQYQFNFDYFKESIRIGGPAGLGRFLELIAHFIFFRIVLLSGSESLTIITVIQSLYLLMSFMIEGLSKGVSSISANLIGGKQGDSLINKVIRSAFILHSIFSALLFVVWMGFAQPLLSIFFSEQEISFMQNPQLVETAIHALFWMSLFFLFDGFGWIYIGFLTACGDTKFLLYAGFALNWLSYILPSYLVLGLAGGTAADGWMLIAMYAIMTFLTYRWRYKVGAWKSKVEESSFAMP
jgi:MATE family multidrug resistance protein